MEEKKRSVLNISSQNLKPFFLSCLNSWLINIFQINQIPNIYKIIMSVSHHHHISRHHPPFGEGIQSLKIFAESEKILKYLKALQWWQTKWMTLNNLNVCSVLMFLIIQWHRNAVVLYSAIFVYIKCFNIIDNHALVVEIVIQCINKMYSYWGWLVLVHSLANMTVDIQTRE